MNKIIIFTIVLIALVSCNHSAGLLKADDFEAGIKQPNVQILDVRTAKEFEKEHIKDAINIDINEDNFVQEISSLDKSKPVFVYCLAGSRSSNAASVLKDNGFKNIYELDGGMLAWLKTSKPVEVENSTSSIGSSGNPVADDFYKTIASEKLTMVDFFAYWCGPCMKMKPDIDKLTEELKEEVTIISINTDEQIALATKYNIQALPTLAFYKNGEEVGRTVGFKSQDQLRALIAQYK